MGRVVAVANQKGGVGKTTTSISLAAGLNFFHKKRVLLVDLDPQANATVGLGFDPDDRSSVYEVLMGEVPMEEVLLNVGKNFDLAPSSINLAGAELELQTVISRETVFKKRLAPLRDKYDYVVVDLPPSLGMLTLNGLVAADSVIIPIQAEFYALAGLAQLLQTVDLVKEALNPDLEIDGVLITMYDSRTNLSKEVEQNVREFFRDRGYVFKTVIPRSVRAGEAPSFGKTVYEHKPKSAVSVAYKRFCSEFLKRVGGK